MGGHRVQYLIDAGRQEFLLLFYTLFYKNLVYKNIKTDNR